MKHSLLYVFNKINVYLKKNYAVSVLCVYVCEFMYVHFFFGLV